MKVIFLTLILAFSFEALAKPKKSHAGHKHKAGEECELAGSGSGAAEKLQKNVAAAVAKLEFSPEFCAAFNECYETEATDCTIAKSYSKELCGLSKQESSALNLYIGSGYRCINGVLYGNEEKEIGALIGSINAGLKKFPRYEGFVTRGTGLPDNILEQHKKAVGSIIPYKAFTSTATKSSTAEGFMSMRSENKTKFLIYSKNGRPVMGFSQGEYEVLFQAPTNFKILHYEFGEGVHHFLMREVPAGETAAQAAKADEFVRQSVKNVAPNNTHKADNWPCPEDGKNKEIVIKQTHVPTFGKSIEYFRK